MLTLGNCSLEQSVLSQNALIERKLSIVMKSLETNPLVEELGLKYL
jgi:hypothetical protein